jgi:carbon monoxide dehydrogenase subunit G
MKPRRIRAPAASRSRHFETTAMKIEKSFAINRARDAVWDAFGDVRLVAACLPGASIGEDLGGGNYKGSFALKLGPMAASFGGEVAIERKREDWMAIVSGKGADRRSGSRANGSMTYRLSGGEGGAPTRVDVVSEINLAGALAQFGKAGVIQEVASRLTNEFVRNFEAKLEAAAPQTNGLAGEPGTTSASSAASNSEHASSAEGAQVLDAGNLLWAIFRDKIAGLFRRLRGKA